MVYSNDDLLKTKAQKREFRNYIGGLLGESERKNIYQMASNSVGVTYHKLHHYLDAVAHGETPKTALHYFLTESTWSVEKINERRLEIMNKCRNVVRPG